MSRDATAEPERNDLVQDVDLSVEALPEFREAFRRWINLLDTDVVLSITRAQTAELCHESVIRFQRRLFDGGWARYGWPHEVGGLGGSAMHRAVVYDELAAQGIGVRGPFEHHEVLIPPVVRHWDHAECGRLVTGFLKGTALWCQGFSEPDSGSDLASLRTRARRDGDGYRVTGRKIWASFSSLARWCVLLARTGDPEVRHRSLSMFMVDLMAPGVVVRPIRQANGVEDLGEIELDDVWVPTSHRIGGEDRGWAVTMDILACERGAYAWMRHAELVAQLGAAAGRARGSVVASVGDAVLDLFAVRASAAAAVRGLDSGLFPGPAAAPIKLLLSRAEQEVYDIAYEANPNELVLGCDFDASTIDARRWQEAYLFSRAVQIYGGTRHLQLATIARFALAMPVQQ